MVYYYCHNSHFLSEAENTIKLLIKSKNIEQELEFFKVNELWQVMENKLEDKEIIKVYCPVCKEEMDSIAPCTCGGLYYAIYSNGKRSYSNCLAMCNTWNCKNSLISSAWKAIKQYGEKNFTIL